MKYRQITFKFRTITWLTELLMIGRQTDCYHARGLVFEEYRLKKPYYVGYTVNDVNDLHWSVVPIPWVGRCRIYRGLSGRRPSALESWRHV